MLLLEVDEQAAVDEQRCAGDVLCEIASEEDYGPCDIVRDYGRR